MELTGFTDEQLMMRYRAGEEAAFTELYRRYHRRLYGYLGRADAGGGLRDEIFQEVWTKLHRTRFRYDAKYPFAAWLFTVARHAMIDAFRKAGKLQAEGKLDEDRTAGEPARETADAPAIPWKDVTADDKKALEWRYLEDATFEEIGERLGLSPVNVRQRISRALKRLRRGVTKPL